MQKAQYKILKWALIPMMFGLLFTVEVAVDRILFTEGSIYMNLHNFMTREGVVAEYVSKPYLNYINNPKHSQDGVPVNNAVGLRGKQHIDMSPSSGTYRVLFLGGSTTYGNRVDQEESFPSQVSAILGKTLLPEYGITAFECLNGGLGGATSAEILAHYLFKYQYLSPDLIVVHTGINDAFSYTSQRSSGYHPDYSHWRTSVQNMKEVGPNMKRLIRFSKIISAMTIRINYWDYFSMDIYRNEFIDFNNDLPWFSYGSDSAYSYSYNAFYNNLRILINTAQSNGHEVLLVSEVLDTTNMPVEMASILVPNLQYHNQVLAELASRSNVSLCRLNEEEFGPDLFYQDEDGIHVNPKGEAVKARYVAPWVIEVATGLDVRGVNSEAPHPAE